MELLDHYGVVLGLSVHGKDNREYHKSLELFSIYESHDCLRGGTFIFYDNVHSKNGHSNIPYSQLVGGM